MADLVINEWLWADSSGDNGPRAQREAFEAINRLGVSNHRAVVVEGSAFDRKAWALCKIAEPMWVSPIARAWVLTVRLNPERCVTVRPEDLSPLPLKLASAIKPDDHYLVQAQIKAAGATLVSTDEPLRNAVGMAGLECISREEFLEDYLSFRRFVP